MNALQLDGHTVVISGAASGVGRALAERLSRSGCPAAINDIDSVGLDATATRLSGKFLARVLDVRDAAGQHEFANEVRDSAPTDIGVVFNNAGVARDANVIDADADDDQWLWDINFHGVVNGPRAFLSMLAKQNSGGIVNISSVYGLAAVGGTGAYCAAKFAVRGFTEALRHELCGTGINATVVHPGGIKTNIARNARVDESKRTRTLPEGDGAGLCCGRAHSARSSSRHHLPRCRERQSPNTGRGPTSTCSTK